MAEFVELDLENGVYLGEVSDNTPHGEGNMKYKNGDKFIGEWVEGEKEYGEMTFNENKNGWMRYEGYWVDGGFDTDNGPVTTGQQQ